MQLVPGLRCSCLDHVLVSMISLCAATSSRVFGRYFSTHGASLAAKVVSTLLFGLASASVFSNLANFETSCFAAISIVCGDLASAPRIYSAGCWRTLQAHKVIGDNPHHLDRLSGTAKHRDRS